LMRLLVQVCSIYIITLYNLHNIIIPFVFVTLPSIDVRYCTPPTTRSTVMHVPIPACTRHAHVISARHSLVSVSFVMTASSYTFCTHHIAARLPILPLSRPPEQTTGDLSHSFRIIPYVPSPHAGTARTHAPHAARVLLRTCLRRPPVMCSVLSLCRRSVLANTLTRKLMGAFISSSTPLIRT